jgi:hypothetical protein
VHNRDGRWVDAGKTLLVFNRCWISQFGYPNDEAIEADALAPGVRNFAGICEVLNSRWIHSLAVANERIFPGSDWFAGARHFVVQFHDGTFHCIARDVIVNLRDVTFEAIWSRVRDSLL